MTDRAEEPAVTSLAKAGWMQLGADSWGKTVDGIHCRASTVQALEMEKKMEQER